MSKEQKKKNSATKRAEASAAPVPDTAGLGPAVSSDLEALKADLEQARGLAHGYQQELLGKATELESTRQLFEKARKHLIQLQINVTQLRDDRHQLANRAMQADSYKLKLQQMTAERDRLRQKIDALRVWQD